jgi:omega-amidase
MRVGIAQMDIAWENPEANYACVEGFVDQAAKRNVDLLVLPEMFALGFTMNGARFAEEEDGPTATFLARCARAGGMHLIGGCVMKGEKKPRNAALLFSPEGELLARYDKIHPFTMSDEQKHYGAGWKPVVVPALGFRIQLTVCYDMRFPELYRAGIEDGADLIAVIANWPVAREGHWRVLARARAVDNLSYVVACNRTGAGGGLSYPGASMIVAPTGEVLAGGRSEETLYTADIEADVVADARRDFPFLRDRRPALYREWERSRDTAGSKRKKP